MKKYILSVILLLTICIGGIFGMSQCAVATHSMSRVDESIVLGDDYDLASEYNSEVGASGDFVYVGGMPLGIDVKSDVPVICGVREVITREGSVLPCKDIDIKLGDRLISIDGIKISSQNEIVHAIRGKKHVTLEIDRDGAINQYVVNTAIDVLTGDERLGLVLKDGITGIGTLTYVDPSTRRYGALGHPIEANRHYRRGAIMTADITGYERGERGKAGALNGEIMPSKVLGNIDKNTDYGIFGTFTGDYEGFRRIEVASRNDIKPGKATILTTINGQEPREYTIEIIKKNYQPHPDTKGIVIRITDKQLLECTNGILQGMSGSPIIQNGKLIGAVTHVFINDPTKGFGVYLDFMRGN